MKLKTTVAAMFAIAVLTGCEDLFEEGDMQPDGSKPSLTINAPTINQNVQQTQGLRIFITGFDKDLVKTLRFTVKQNETDVLSFERALDKKAFEYDTTIAMSNASAGTYQLLVRAVDGRTNVAEQKVSFTVR
ncbi:hypothetical protein H7F15_16200 [Pontibacter sp. Tf4]|uniref:hypothetical protein n=1 Tax=Pontibacter sp. Tf4 TaxID=2761620 RepID=UPI0016295F93|nr:hypothetical protein [Pontibacter sp. Tf4]MBB6612587.1 hypothetical protein [Pontibacter sp. Tf4]